ncbi:MAG: glutathione S-transferase N-terminal domain-containing protein [Pseudomonadota bacterium]
MTTGKFALYGVPNSLYTGRARSYFIKAGLAYREVSPADPHYQAHVIAAAGGRLGLPTVELEDGTVIRDGAAIIDHFEAQSGHLFSPTTPKQRFFSRLFDAIGAEGLLRPAMHYRWNFDEENLAYLQFHFAMLAPPTEEGVKLAKAAAQSMRAATVAFGVTPETAPMVEEVYAEQMAALNAHFGAYPYLLGTRPCIGDFGLYAPLFAHLGRDPKPLMMLMTKALRLYRWVERMGRETSDTPEFPDQSESYLADDAIPDTLVALLKAMAIDFAPETLAAAETINAWIADQGDLAPLTTCARGVGMASFEVRGTQFNALAQPYRFYLLARAQTEREAMNTADRKKVDAILAETGLEAALNTTLAREFGIRDNREVWL